MSIENWKNNPATKSARLPGSGVEGRHRVSFSLVESHETDQPKQREKWREPVPHSRKVWLARNHPDQPQDLRYNYEQPGFVEREQEVSGKPYTIYEVHGSKESSKGSTGRQLKFQIARAFSLREQTSHYTRMSRAFSVNGAGSSNLLPVGCVSCGEVLGIVVLGFHANNRSLCQTCKPSARGRLTCSDGSKPSKKKSIVEYCRKLLKLPKKVK